MSEHTLVLVGCGSSKREERTYAYQLYDSDYFAKKMVLGMTVGEPAILSAEHGLVYSDEKLEPYDTHITDLSETEKEQWAHSVADELYDRRPDRLLLLIPQSYQNALATQLTIIKEKTGMLVYDPFAETEGIGEQMKWLKGAVRAIRDGESLYEVMP